MNKQLNKKVIGIAASAALIASAAFTGSALAAKGGKPQASIGVSTWCEIKPEDEAEGDMTVHVKIKDKSSGVAYGTVSLESVLVQGGTKTRGKDFYDIAGAFKNATADVVVDDTFYPVTINLCDGGDLGNAINASTKVVLKQEPYPSSKGEYTAQCTNAPGPDGLLGTDDDVIIGGLKTADYPNLCTAP